MTLDRRLSGRYPSAVGKIIIAIALVAALAAGTLYFWKLIETSDGGPPTVKISVPNPDF